MMTGWLKLTDKQRQETLAQAQAGSGIGVKALEKDWWVTLTLKALFQSEYSKWLVFKGGTSLSKGWKYCRGCNKGNFRYRSGLKNVCHIFILGVFEVPRRSRL